MLKFKINTAGIIIQFASRNPDLEYDPSQDDRFRGFVYTGGKDPEISFEIEYIESVPDFSKEKEPVFVVSGHWNLYKIKDKLLYEYPEKKGGSGVERAALVSWDMKQGTIYMTKKERKIGPFDSGKTVMSEIKANFFQVFLLDYLMRYKIGMLGHGLTLEDNNIRLIFMGRSGAGKSTLAKIYSQHSGVRIYNDDRAILRYEEGDFVFHNAPWTGMYVQGYVPDQNDTFKLDKILFIYHERENKIRRLTVQEATTHLFKNTFPPFWRRDTMMDALAVSAAIAKKIPCFELGFVNDDRVVEFVRKNTA